MTQLESWVRPSAAEVVEVRALADRQREHGVGVETDYAAGVAAAIAWVSGSGSGPATGREGHSVTRGAAIAELWAAASLSDGGGTSERELRAAAEDQAVPYRAPLWDSVPLETGYGIYRALSWLTASQDGYMRGRVSPMELALRS